MEMALRRKDGSAIWVGQDARIIYNEKGGIAYIEGSLWDISERKEAEAARRQARLQAEIAIRSRLDFLANMSHELRTPLNAIIGFSELIKNELMGPLGTVVYKDYAQDIYDSGQNLMKIIGDILEVSKLEMGNRELNVGNVNLRTLIDECRMMLASRIEKAQVQVSIRTEDRLPEVLVESLAFKQIIMNLMSNAVKFTQPGGKVSIDAHMREDGGIDIDIADTGIGMTEEDLKKVMQPFVRLDNAFTTSKEGTGLGLTIVEQLTRLHRCDFHLSSRKDEGTTAKVTIPAFRVLV
jgi:signal transduction histidine kinase